MLILITILLKPINSFFILPTILHSLLSKLDEFTRFFSIPYFQATFEMRQPIYAWIRFWLEMTQTNFSKESEMNIYKF